MLENIHSVEKIDFVVDASNIQVQNSIDCSGGPQQIATVQVNDDDLQKAVCSLNLTQRKTFSIVGLWARNKLKINEFSLSKCFRTITFIYNR